MNHKRNSTHLEQDSTFVLVHSCDVARPNAEVVLLDVVGSRGIVILSVVLSELQSLHDPPEQNVVQLKNVQSCARKIKGILKFTNVPFTLLTDLYDVPIILQAFAFEV